MVDDCILYAGDDYFSKVYEDEEVLAFWTSLRLPGHTLVMVPKNTLPQPPKRWTPRRSYLRVSKVAKK